MAITPRTILTNPSTATVTALSLFAVTALGLYAYSGQSCSSKARHAVVMEAPMSDCDLELERADRSRWSESQWIRSVECFGREQNATSAASTAYEGLNYYPRSEALYDMRGYYLIELKQYKEAVATLETGLRRIGTPRYGTIENNLAWAGLWAPREMTLTRARQLYTRALTRSAPSCELVHTGLWVEFALSESSQGLERARALRNFNNLRHAYESCTPRFNQGERQMLEVFSASVLFERVDRDMAHPDRRSVNCTKRTQLASSHFARAVARQVRASNLGDAETICQEAMPVASAHHLCITALGRTR